MDLDELEISLNELHDQIDGSIDLVTRQSTKAQSEIEKAIIALINRFEITDGRFVANQALSSRIRLIEKKIIEILGDIYTPAVTEYLPIFQTIEQRTIALQQSYNGINVPKSLISPIKKTLIDQASYYLSDGLAEAYIQPAKYLIMQQVTQGLSLTDTRKVIEQWGAGELPASLRTGRQTPNLQRYATQVARDTSYQHYGAIQEIIAEEYDLKSFIYTGDIISDSRPMCKHLVGLKRKIKLDEMPALIKKYPQGLYPNTTKKNFIQVRAGFSCRHGAFAVRD